MWLAAAPLIAVQSLDMAAVTAPVALGLMSVEEGVAQHLQVPGAVERDGLPAYVPELKVYRPTYWAELRSRLTTYRFMFTFVLAANLAFAVPAMTGLFIFARRNVARIAAANIVLALLTRNELFMRAMYWLEVMLFKWRWIPTIVKHCVVSFQHNIGGIHSGSSASSVVWLAFLTFLTAKGTPLAGRPWWLLLLTCCILALLVAACISAYPALRAAMHELFENLHRYCGWTCLAGLWCLVLLSDSYRKHTDSFDFQTTSVLRRFELWCTVVATILIVLPWIGVRKVRVHTEVPGEGTMLIHFPGWVGRGLLGRISRKPMLEWHAFAIVSKEHADSHLMMVSAVGDFTRGLVADPPAELYVRTVRFAGLLYLAQLYSRVVMVATGTGVSPMLSNILQPTNVVHLVWVGRHIRQTFGEKVWDMVHQALPADRLTIIDTAVDGRPDMVGVTCQAVQAVNAQAVFLGSNPAGTKVVLDGCRANGIVCFGPLWDS